MAHARQGEQFDSLMCWNHKQSHRQEDSPASVPDMLAKVCVKQGSRRAQGAMVLCSWSHTLR